ncbi:unnamed protein product [Spirodela intermedia]|uniref:Uncharacterized protein n=1 Tax=Spirodela intermedia TaxID=51605 RepID=A0ABN7EAE2_SPIIN|nr:unnamed protein product [Spirodela intermedia]
MPTRDSKNLKETLLYGYITSWKVSLGYCIKIMLIVQDPSKY